MTQIPNLRLVVRACPVCGETVRYSVFAEQLFDAALWTATAFSSRKLPEYMHFRVLRCSICNVLYSSPAPDPETIFNLYRSASFEAREESVWAARTYAQLIRSARLSMETRILDIGAGDGTFLEAILDLGFQDVLGIEPSTSPIEQASARVKSRLKHAIFKGQDFKPGSFDLITCFQTIEHVYNPADLARDVLRLLRPGGKFLVVCHNSRSLSAHLLGTKSPIFDIEHLQIFSKDSLRFLFEVTGYHQSHIRMFWNTYPTEYWAKLFPFPDRLKREVLRFLSGSGMGKIPIPLAAGNLVAWAEKARESTPSG